MNNIKLAPLERLVLPTSLDGSTEHYRCEVSKVPVEFRDDVSAMLKWLSIYAKTESTLKAYRLPLEHFILWMAIVRRLPLSRFSVLYLDEYRIFLQNPPPDWIKTSSLSREDSEWRPFKSSLSPRVIIIELRLVVKFFGWYTDMGYISRDPWKGYLGSRVDLTVRERPRQVVTAVEWSYIEAALEQLDTIEPDEYARVRRRAIVYLGYYGNLKAGEISGLCALDINVSASNGPSIWTLCVSTRNPVMSKIVLIPPLQQAIADLLAEIGLASEVVATSATPFRIKLTGHRYKTVPSDTLFPKSGLNSLIKPIFRLAAEMAIGDGNAFASNRLNAATLGWLRHALEVHMVNMKIHSDWAWHLVASRVTTVKALAEFLPARDLSASSVSAGVNAVRPLYSSFERPERTPLVSDRQ